MYKQSKQSLSTGSGSRIERGRGDQTLMARMKGKGKWKVNVRGGKTRRAFVTDS